MSKLDMKREMKELYRPSRTKVCSVEVPELKYLMVDGMGDPNTAPAYKQSIEALYSLSYTIKFDCKKIGKDFTVMPLEGLWWADEMGDFREDNKDTWKWTSMILQPDFVTKEMVENTRVAIAKKKSLEALPLVRFEPLTEGKCAQLMHIGPYSEEEENINKIHNWIEENGFRLRGKHHEIYLSDPRRNKPENLKTIIRQPYE